MSKTLLFVLSITIGAVACLYYSGDLNLDGLKAIYYLVQR